MLHPLYLISSLLYFHSSTSFASRPRFRVPRSAGVKVPNPHEFPSTVWLKYSRDPAYVCGGTLISNNMVLTTATCLDQKEAGDLIVVAGDDDRHTEEGTEQLRQGVKFVSHKGFKPESYAHDIAILTVDRPFKVNRFVGVAAIEYDPPVGMGTGTALGWGHVTDGKPHSLNILHKMNLPAADGIHCAHLYPKIWNPDTMLCYGGAGEGQSTCQGDNGGTLWCNGNLCGIAVSHEGHSCGDFPTIYTGVGFYLEWIEEMANYLQL